MPLISFSEPAHVPLLLSGAKVQTTRAPRKVPLKVGDVLKCYYKPRQKASCKNCIILQPCSFQEKIGFSIKDNPLNCCTSHNNYFGEAVITQITHHWKNWPENFNPKTIGELFLEPYDHRIGDVPAYAQEWWAIADGFKNFQAADDWFYEKTKSARWMFQDLDVIKFEPRWVE